MHNSVVVSSPDSKSGSTGFDPGSALHARGSLSFHPSEVGKLVPALAGGGKSFVRTLGGECRAAVRVS